MQRQQKQNLNDRHFSNGVAIVLSELLFSVLPIIILAIVFFSQNKAPQLFLSPEWSVTAAIFFGQSIVKVVSASVSRGNKKTWQRIVLLVTVILVVGLAPSLVILALILILSPPPFWLAVAQIGLFIVSLITFFVLGSAGQVALEEK